MALEHSLYACTVPHTYVLLLLYCHAVVSSRMAWENIFMSEVVRSCPEMCR